MIPREGEDDEDDADDDRNAQQDTAGNEARH
jgi:hypothetical protein